MADQQQNEAGAKSLSDEELETARQHFALFDANNDGTISREEIIKALRALGQNPTDKDVEEMIKTLDANDDGRIEFNEFVKLYTKNKKEPKEEYDELKQAFSKFDKDGSGKISKKELSKVLSDNGMTQEDIDEMFKEADTDGNQEIDVEEFAKQWSQ